MGFGCGLGTRWQYLDVLTGIQNYGIGRGLWD